MDFIDVSQFQGNIDWEKVSKKYTMAIIRAGYRGYAAGNIKEDPYARKNIKGALDNGIKVGLYFMSQAVNQSEADAEAQFCIALLRAYGITSAEIAYDSEWSGAPNRSGRADGLSKAARTEICNRFCLIVAQAGYSPLCYASTSWFDEHLVKSDLHMGIWCAQYASRNTLTGLAWKYWQYTSSGSVDGIQGKVDLSRTAEGVVSGPAQNVTTAADRIDVRDGVMTLSLAEDGEKLFYIDGKKNGFGIEFRAVDGGITVADFCDGERNFIFAKFDKNRSLVYAGSRYGEKSGGISINPENGEIFIAKSRNGEQQQKGTVISADGILLYSGDYKNGSMDGEGTLFNEDGSIKYKGEFRRNLYSGNGMLFFVISDYRRIRNQMPSGQIGFWELINSR